MLSHLDKMKYHVSTEERVTRLIQTPTCDTLWPYPLEPLSSHIHQLHAQSLQKQITADCLPFNLKPVEQRHVKCTDSIWNITQLAVVRVSLCHSSTGGR